MIIEVGLIKLALYLLQSEGGGAPSLDLVSCSGYKFIAAVLVLLAKTFLGAVAGYVAILACGASIGTFMVQTIRQCLVQVTGTQSVRVRVRVSVRVCWGREDDKDPAQAAVGASPHSIARRIFKLKSGSGPDPESGSGLALALRGGLARRLFQLAAALLPSVDLAPGPLSTLDLCPLSLPALHHQPLPL